jgi:hypothetical protein
MLLMAQHFLSLMLGLSNSFSDVVELRKHGIEKFIIDVGPKYLSLFFDQVSPPFSQLRQTA